MPRSLINILGPLVIVGALVSLPVGLAILGVIGFDEDLLFFILAEVMLLSGLLVVTMRDIIRCGLAMIVCFLSLAGIYVIAGAPLVAAAQVLIYIGAISVLILFAIMLTQTKDAPPSLVFQTQALGAGVASVILGLIIVITVSATDWGEVGTRLRTATDALAEVLFRDYVLAFEIVSVLLLAAVIGGIYVAKREEGGAP
ncbi:MAG: NADH-quinone oxidoreductase subunit J [Chloroflexi bacterium]|nr:NADH-quinone oxidoreductase subunit J [Chloroflexota bacterium]